MPLILVIALSLIVGYVLCLLVQRLAARRNEKLNRQLVGVDLRQVAAAETASKLAQGRSGGGDA